MTTRSANVTFRLYPRATFSERVVLRDVDGAPVDLTGYSAWMQIHRDRDALALPPAQQPAPLFDLSTAAGFIVLDAAGGIQITIPATHTDPSLTPPFDLDGEALVYDLLLVNSTVSPACVERTLQGWVYVYPGVTRPPIPSAGF